MIRFHLYTSVFKLPPGGGPSLHVVYGLIGTKGLCIEFIGNGSHSGVAIGGSILVATATHK